MKATCIPKSTYYYEISKIDVVEGRYGVGRVHRKLLNLGYKINHKKVQRLMNKMGLLARRPKSKYRSYKGEIGKVATNIIDRDFNFSPILDMYRNEIISYHISLSPNLELVSRMLKKAFKKYPNIEDLIFYSDQGWYINELKNIILDNLCQEKAVMEYFLLD